MNLLPVSLAFCDGFAAKKFVSTSGRTASTLIQLPDFSTFEKKRLKIFDLLRRLEFYGERERERERRLITIPKKETTYLVQ